MRRREILHKDAIKVIGIETRTTNRDEEDSRTAKIPKLWESFFHENVGERVPNKVSPGNMLEIYTDYESDEHVAYTVILGFEVTSFQHIPEGMIAKSIPASNYVVLTTNKGSLSSIVKDAWREIWTLSIDQLGGKRRFSGDFEIFDERSQDPQNAEVDIYIAIE